MDELDVLADQAAKLRFEDLPARVVERAHWVVRDTVGAILGGMAEPEVTRLASYAAAKAPGLVTIAGFDRPTTAEYAVLVHGTAGVTLELDEGHAFAQGHAAIHAVPTALALGELHGWHGEDVLTAVVVGYEVAARVGVATQLHPPVHPFGTWGVLGAAAIGGWSNGVDGRGMRNILDLAASYAINPSFDAAFKGANVRNTYAGIVNRTGLLAADMNSLGFVGEPGGVQTTFGAILGDFDPSLLVDGLGERFEIERGYFKPYSACRYTHAVVEACLNLRPELGDMINEIESIVVATYEVAARLSDPRPSTPLAARFSIPYVVAAVLTDGSAGPEMFEPEMLTRPDLGELAAKVTVNEAAELTALTPAKRPARLKLRFTGGQTLESTAYGAKGDPDNPMHADELQDKFMQLATRRLDHDRAVETWTRLGKLAESQSVSAVMASLRTA